MLLKKILFGMLLNRFLIKIAAWVALNQFLLVVVSLSVGLSQRRGVLKTIVSHQEIISFKSLFYNPEPVLWKGGHSNGWRQHCD
jgi:hypothetical protein